MLIRALPLVGLLALSAIAQTAFADVSRICRANISARAGGKNVLIANIEGKGFCKNKFHADDCRTRARKSIEACLGALWPAHMSDQPPQECRAATGGRPSANLVYDGIYLIPHSSRYLQRLAHAGCCLMQPTQDFVTVSVWAEKWGKNHCAGFKVSKDHYEDENVYVHGPVNFDCKKRRAEGLCG